MLTVASGTVSRAVIAKVHRAAVVWVIAFFPDSKVYMCCAESLLQFPDYDESTQTKNKMYFIFVI